MNRDSENLIIFFIFLALKCQKKTNLVSDDKIMKILVNAISSKREWLGEIQLLAALKRTEECENYFRILTAK